MPNKHGKNCMQVQQCQQQQRQANLHLNSRVVLFGGAPMVELCKKVQHQASRFHRKPIGPLGALLSLSEAQYVWNS